ncbi:hypothetical protein V8E36_001906 [Tilletia maclaganii]
MTSVSASSANSSKKDGRQPAGPSPPTRTLEDHIQHLKALLTSQPNAEELQRVWDGFSTAPPATQGSHSPTGEPLKVLALGLKDYKRALDTGRRLVNSSVGTAGPEARRLHQGIPLWMVVRTLKASWHAEGSWPLVGCDAPEQDTKVTLPNPSSSASGPRQAGGTEGGSRPTMTIPRSCHPSALLIKPKVAYADLMTAVDPGPPARPDPSSEQIRNAYRARGIALPDPPVLSDSDYEAGAQILNNGGDDASDGQSM